MKLHCAEAHCQRIICRAVDPYDGGDVYVDFHDGAPGAVFHEDHVALRCWSPKCERRHLLNAQALADAVLDAMRAGRRDVYLSDLVYP